MSKKCFHNMYLTSKVEQSYEIAGFAFNNGSLRADIRRLLPLNKTTKKTVFMTHPASVL